MEDKNDSDFVRQLFKENNELRLKVNGLTREVYNKSVVIESVEDEMRELRIKLEFAEKDPLAKPTTTAQSLSGSNRRIPDKRAVTDGGDSSAFSSPIAKKELDEALWAIDQKNAESKQFKEDLAKIQQENEELAVVGQQRESELYRATEDVKRLRLQVQQLQQQKSESAVGIPLFLETLDPEQTKVLLEPTIRETNGLDKLNKVQEQVIASLRKQIITMASDVNRKHNEQQSQLQGVEALVDGIRIEYDEFIQVTKVETESYKATQQAEYESLRICLERHKSEQFEEKKRIMNEYQCVMFYLQAQFDEYRATGEYLFNVEVAKLQDEMTSQALCDQQEIIYIIQAKDKFYSEMMVGKDAKIMSLIEGSDLQSIMQKHELDMEILRKDHQREIERVKSDQESEQKNLIALLQRQNVSLESKCEKLQSHLKNVENRTRELMVTIESKNKALSEREDQRMKIEEEISDKLEDSRKRIEILTQQKEHLRHKVMRLTLSAKGEGANTVENMVKRVSQETSKLYANFESLSAQYDSVIVENKSNAKRLKEETKLAEFLEKELKKRNTEYQSMTLTFEEFLSGRARQSRRAHSRKLLELHVKKSLLAPDPMTHLLIDNKSVIRAVIPSKEDNPSSRPSTAHDQKKNAQESEEKVELERGYDYLRKFKTLSRAFASGDFRNVPVAADIRPSDNTDTVRNSVLYSKLRRSNISSASKVYLESGAMNENQSMIYKAKGYTSKTPDIRLSIAEEANQLKIYTPAGTKRNSLRDPLHTPGIRDQSGMLVSGITKCVNSNSIDE